jgi:hypothetical protein
MAGGSAGLAEPDLDCVIRQTRFGERDLVKREKRPFLVEVRRGKKPEGKAEVSKPGVAWPRPPVETGPPQEPSPQASMLQAEPPPETPKAVPTGRILPSLVEEPVATGFAEDEAPRRRGRPPGSKNRTPREPAAAKDGPPRRRGRPPKPRPVPQPFVWPDEPEEAPVAAPEPAPVHAAPAESGPPQARQRRESRILSRYVYGTTPKRGERWKREFR